MTTPEILPAVCTLGRAWGRQNTAPENGSGLIATIASVLVFLVFLLFSVQLLVGLYGRSVVTGAAYDGARAVAGHRSTDRVRSQLDAEARVRQEVGNMALRFDWTGSDDRVISLRVQAENPRFMLPGFAAPMATDHIDRTVTVRVERVR